MHLLPFLLTCSIVLGGIKKADDCGGSYRWDNKILIDAEGLKLFKKKPVASTVHKLNAFTKPAQSQLGSNRPAVERKKVTLTAYIVGLGQEDDGDYHLILAGTNYKDSIIAEIPDPTCPKLDHFPGLRDLYTKARAFIEENIDGNPGAIYYLQDPFKVKITGVVFFDKHAHGNGHSGNDAEMHPVMKVVKG